MGVGVVAALVEEEVAVTEEPDRRRLIIVDVGIPDRDQFHPENTLRIIKGESARKRDNFY